MFLHRKIEIIRPFVHRFAVSLESYLIVEGMCMTNCRKEIGLRTYLIKTSCLKCTSANCLSRAITLCTGNAIGTHRARSVILPRLKLNNNKIIYIYIQN